MLVALVATWFVPQGFFDTAKAENGRDMVVAGSFQLVEEKQYMSPLALLTAIPKAFAQAQDVIFFVLIVGGVLSIARRTGTVDALLGRLLERYGNNPRKLVFMVIFCFAIASSSIGTAGEYIPFVLILVALCKAMRMDSMTVAGMVVTGYGIGYGVSAFNPFTVLIAQQLADIPVYSGLELRLAIFIPFVLIGFHHVWSYSQKVLDDPTKSLVAGIDCPLKNAAAPVYPKLNARHKLILASFVITLVTAIWGIATKGWYLYELGAVFIAWGLVTSILGKLSSDDAANSFIEGTKELVPTAILIGVARGIALVLDEGQILHSMVYYMSLPLAYVSAEVSAVGMLIMQTLLNTFIPSGSGQAYVTMPLMVPLADLVNVPRQVAVLAYQFGDGFSNMIIPTNAVLMGIIGMAGVPYQHWVRFCFPLLVKLMLAASLVLIVAVNMGYGLDVQPQIVQAAAEAG